jgi:hypothetical protein
MMTLMSIALALTTVCDRAFNRGDLTLRLYANARDVRDWAERSGGDVAETFIGFRAS